MTTELILKFRTSDKLSVHFDGRDCDEFDFKSPLTKADQKDIQWYLEIYASSYTTDVDDQRAAQIVEKLPQWGQALFNAAFNTRSATRLYEDFLKAGGHLLNISAKHSAILSLPWELLYDPENTFLCDHDPTISICRRLGMADTVLKPFVVTPKQRLRVLFVVSRPTDAGFIDPRADAKAVLKALDEEASGRFELEFLRPPTLDNLTKRLERRAKYRKFPPVDVIHFDGHGVFQTMGYLLFENSEAQKHLVDADTLGNMLNSKKVGLIILSACQSAALGGDEPMSSVAARLTHAGIPAVLAMTHSVLVATTKQLFATFYESLAYGAGIGQSLDDARRHLYSHPERGERQRGQERIILKLYDWFLPALYQAGTDTPLLIDNQDNFSNSSPKHNLPPIQEAGFFGRSYELWQIERAFVVQATRRLTISGFGGQGKTYLAIEAGSWLAETGLFDWVCFVDYAAFQGEDAVGLAISTLATLWQENLVDVEAANEILPSRPTLLILDNLESLKPAALQALLTVAKSWSEIGKCRVLLTTRNPDFHHSDYPTEGSLIHQSLALSGLAENDALVYFQGLLKLPPAPQLELPKREVVLEIFKQVSFHPLSIGLIARQLKTRRPAELGMRLEKLIAETPDNPLLASLNLSLDKLDEEARAWLPKLGVFQGGAMEDVLRLVTELSEEEWNILRSVLETNGLIQLDVDMPYIKFHPTLASALWTRLSAEEQTQLRASHRLYYYQLFFVLYIQDKNNPDLVRAIAFRELPNLLYAVHGALEMDEEWALVFVKIVNTFLYFFGLKDDSKLLIQLAENTVGKMGSHKSSIILETKGEQLFNAGSYQEAEQVFKEVLTRLGDIPSYNLVINLGRLGRCLARQGKEATAAKYYRQGLALAEQLEQSESLKQEISILQTDLADVLMNMEDYNEAQTAYEVALTIATEQDDSRMIAAVEGKIAMLMMEQGKLEEAEKCNHKALDIFQLLKEPESEAVAHYQLGRVYEKAKLWDKAEQAYREVARICEYQDDLVGALTAWNQLAIVTEFAGKLEAAEAWYRKGLNVDIKLGNPKDIAIDLQNLADLLQKQPHRLAEAQQLAEQALDIIKQNLDPAAAKIWNIYDILADIADKQNNTAKASEYRCLSREARAAFKGTRYELRKHGQLIAMVVAAVDDAEVRQQLESWLETFGDGWKNLVAAIHRVLDGERDEEVLCEPLDFEEAPIINAILRGIEEPETLKELLE